MKKIVLLLLVTNFAHATDYSLETTQSTVSVKKEKLVFVRDPGRLSIAYTYGLSQTGGCREADAYHCIQVKIDDKEIATITDGTGFSGYSIWRYFREAETDLKRIRDGAISAKAPLFLDFSKKLCVRDSQGSACGFFASREELTYNLGQELNRVSQAIQTSIQTIKDLK